MFGLSLALAFDTDDDVAARLFRRPAGRALAEDELAGKDPKRHPVQPRAFEEDFMRTEGDVIPDMAPMLN
jgi:hypothetical protein